MTQPKGRNAPAATPPTPAETPSDGLGIEEAAWPTGAGAEVPAPILAKLRESWDAKVPSGTGERHVGKAYTLTVPDDSTRKLRTRQLRQGAEQLGIGVSIQESPTDGNGFRLLFRTRTRRIMHSKASQ